jgi:hypothetical protein
VQPCYVEGVIPLDRLPAELWPMASALELIPCRPVWHDTEPASGAGASGWGVPPHRGAPVHPLIPNAPPYDGVFRGSWVSPGICLRCELTNATIPAAVRKCLQHAYIDQIGTDGYFYEYGIESKSQHNNAENAILNFAIKVATAL